jgi:hypothetical protein
VVREMKATDRKTDNIRVVTWFTTKTVLEDERKESLREETSVMKSTLKNKK